MSKYTNRAGSAAQKAGTYIEALLALLGSEDPTAVLGSTVSWCTQVTDGLTPSQLTAPEAPDKWSVAAVIHHLADSELVWGYRIRMVLADDRPVLQGYDQDQWAGRLGYAAADRDDSLSLFSALRSSNLSLLSQASEEDLDRVAVHKERGEESLRHMISLYAGHDLVHRRQIQRVVDGFASPG